MGFRVIKHTGMFPASMVNGVINVADDVIPPIQLPPAYGSVNFEEQCHNITNLDVKCYLTSDKYEFILWENGTAANYYIVNHCLLNLQKPGSFEMPSEKYLEQRLRYGGVMQIGRSQQTSSGGQAYLYFSDNGKIYLVADNCKLIGNNVTPNTYYYHYRRTCNLSNSPFIFYEDNVLKCNAFGKEFLVECESVLNTEYAHGLEGVL